MARHVGREDGVSLRGQKLRRVPDGGIPAVGEEAVVDDYDSPGGRRRLGGWFGAGDFAPAIAGRRGLRRVP